MMNNRLTNITTEYRKFSKGQYVEHTQFNEFLDYFEDQDRLSKTLLRGVGIACGLKHQLIYANTRATKGIRVVTGVEISQGVGVTTDGDLITLSNIAQVSNELGVSDLKTIDLKSKTYSFTKPYDNSKVNYPPFYDDNGNQIPLWELSDTNTSGEYVAVSEPNEDILDVLYLLIYVESYEKEVRPCRGVDCDNHGLQQIQNVKLLYTTRKGVENIVNKADTLYPHPLNITTPELKLKRAIANSELDSISDFKNVYSKIVLDPNLLNQISEGMSVITSHFKMNNNFDIAAITTQLNNVLALGNDTATGFQYAYDFMKDLVDTYNEIKVLLPKSFTNCFPDMNAFPKHLMIGKVVDNTPNNYRHAFYNSPVLDDEEIEAKVKLLIQRFNELIDKFTLPQVINKVAPAINITPSKKSGVLENKAIPFYYNLDDDFIKGWSFGKTRHRIANRNLTYNNLNPVLSDDLNVREAITFNLEKNNFYRIEGHQSQPYSIVADILNTKKENAQLSFDVMSLSLEELNNNKDLSKAYYKEYVEKNPGIEHMAGVESGGTFVLVYESESNPSVIADFSLPYLCCGPKEEVSLSLPVDQVCSGSKAIPFTVSPLNGVVEADVPFGTNGGVTKVGEQYFFSPTLVSMSLYDTDIAFTVNGKPTSANIRVVSQPDIQIMIDDITLSENNTDAFVTFKIEGANLSNYQYEFDYLGNGNYVTETPLNGIITHTFFNINNSKTFPTIKVRVSGNGCSDIIEIPWGITIQPVVTGVSFPDGDCCAGEPIVARVSFPNENCCEDKPIIDTIAYSGSTCCEEVLMEDLKPIIGRISYTGETCCEEILIQNPKPIIGTIRYTSGNCCEQLFVEGR